jgi:hypothetical protein
VSDPKARLRARTGGTRRSTSATTATLPSCSRSQKEHLVKTANMMALSGLAIVALAVTGAVLLIVSFVVPGAQQRSSACAYSSRLSSCGSPCPW